MVFIEKNTSGLLENITDINIIIKQHIVAYLSERQTIKLNQMKDQLPMEVEYLTFQRFHKTESGNVNGLVFRAFDDQVLLIYTSIDSKTINGSLRIDFISGFYLNVESCPISSYQVPNENKITDIADMINKKYFR
jgi:hypothetical protein